MIGIYKIENKINGKVYIGQSNNIIRRWEEHISKLNNNSHENKILQYSWNKYGIHNFDFSILDITDSVDELNEKEIYWIKKFNSFELGYNLTFGGSGRTITTNVIQQIIEEYSNTNNISLIELSRKYNIHQSTISNILNEHNIREKQLSYRKIVGVSVKDINDVIIFNSVSDAYSYFNSSQTNQINKSIKDKKYTAFGYYWFDFDKYEESLKNNNLQELFYTTYYQDIEKYCEEKLPNVKHTKCTKVICITTQKIFNSIAEAAKFYNIKSPTGICEVCTYKKKHCGVDSSTNTKLIWMYYDEYMYMINNGLTYEQMIENYIPKNKVKKVICLNTLEVFNSVSDANIFAGLSRYSGTISENCLGKASYAGRDSNNNPLRWMYYEDYIKLSKSDLEEILNQQILKKVKSSNNKFVCLNNKKIFNTIAQAMKFSNLKSCSAIYDCCIEKKKTAGKHPITGEPLKWMYYSDYIKLYNKDDLEEYVS